MIYLDSQFLYDDKDFMGALNNNLLPRIKWGMENEEHIPTGEGIHPKFKKSKEVAMKMCEEEILNQKIEIYSIIKHNDYEITTV